MRNHIQKERDFQLLYRTGRRFPTTNTIVYARSASTNSHAYAVVVPNAVIPQAVRRNLVRRRIRSIIDKNQERLRGKLILISVKKDISKLSFSVLQEELCTVFLALNRNSK